MNLVPARMGFITSLMFKALETGLLLFFSQQLCPYAALLLPELYALPPPNFFKFHVPTSGLARTLFMYLLPLCRTQFLTAFISVNLLATFRKHLKNISFPIDILCLPLTHHLRFNFYFVLYKLIYLLTYLLTYLTSFCLCRWHRHRVTWNH